VHSDSALMIDLFRGSIASNLYCDETSSGNSFWAKKSSRSSADGCPTMLSFSCRNAEYDIRRFGLSSLAKFAQMRLFPVISLRMEIGPVDGDEGGLKSLIERSTDSAEFVVSDDEERLCW